MSEAQFNTMLTEIEKQIDSMDENPPHIRTRVLFFQAMAKLLDADRYIKPVYSPVRLAVACMTIKVSVPSGVEEQTIENMVRVMAKGAAKGVILYAKRVALVAELDLISIVDDIIAAALKDVNVKLELS